MTNQTNKTMEEWKSEAEKLIKISGGNVDDAIGMFFGKCMDWFNGEDGCLSIKRLPMFTEMIKTLLTTAQNEAREEERSLNVKMLKKRLRYWSSPGGADFMTDSISTKIKIELRDLINALTSTQKEGK